MFILVLLHQILDQESLFEKDKVGEGNEITKNKKNDYID